MFLFAITNKVLVSKPTVQNKNNIAVISLQNMLSRAVTDSWAQRWSHKFDTFRCVEPAQSMYSHSIKDIRLLIIPSKSYQESTNNLILFLQIIQLQKTLRISWLNIYYIAWPWSRHKRISKHKKWQLSLIENVFNTNISNIDELRITPIKIFIWQSWYSFVPSWTRCKGCKHIYFSFILNLEYNLRHQQ